MKKKTKETILSTYYPTLDQEISTSIAYLHTPINWSMSLVTAIVLFLINRESYPDNLAWMALSGSLILVSHFAVRSAKAYISTIRFSTIQRELLRSLIHSENEDSDDFKEYIQKYHIEWHSPINLKTVIYKLLFELGYGYLYLIIITVKVHILLNIQINLISVIFTSVCVLIVLAEFFALKFSPYLKNITVNLAAQKLR